ncbi:EthD domain-containing protein [Exophiala viscosa]|uniref:EthD domain-containing protein n=1 Tax=Exophiala viscosa TaxID=2486360 RepID=A0AAN6DZU3_9EURO|nr:EthD domain-containing protein [Exophiala viscosa]
MGAPSFPLQHDFVFDRLSPEAKPNHQPYVKLTFFFKKRADISYEDFHKHWETVHADLAVASEPFGLYIARYTQYHQTPQLKSAAETCVEGMELLDFDGCSEILVNSLDNAISFFKSPEYMEDMNLDEGNWLERPVRMMIGYDNLIFGQALPLPGTNNGLSSSDLQRALQKP